MLDRDPNADPPPDPRPRSRSHKPKNAPKKQPQRGLGVAQLEKLRLEEQSKQQEATCVASLQQQNFHHQSRYLHFQQQDQQAPYLHYQHPNFLQQHYHSQNSPLRVPRQINCMEPSYETSSLVEPRFPPPSFKLNIVQNSFFPLTTLANRGQTRPLPLVIPQQQLLAEDEASTSPISQVHDLCSPVNAHMRPSSAESRLSPLITRPSPPSLVEKSWLSHLYDKEPNIENDFTVRDLSSAGFHDNATKMQGQNQSVPDNCNAAIANFHGKNGGLSMSMGNLFMQGDGYAAPITDSCPRSRPDGAFDTRISPRTQLESLSVGIVSDGVQMKELSSFQNISLCPTWSTADKALNKKRSWACTQEFSRPAEAFKGVDLNTSIDEMESGLTEQDPNTSLPFAIRDDWNLLPVKSFEKFNDSECKGLVSDKSCSRCDSIKMGGPFSNAGAGGAAFLGLQNQSVNSENWKVETPGDFLTLGPSSSSVLKTRDTASGIKSCCTNHVSKSWGKNADPWYPERIIVEQVRNSCLSSASTTANSDVMSLEYQLSYFDTPMHRKVGFSDFFACDKVDAQLQDSSTDQTLDLELRLSI